MRDVRGPEPTKRAEVPPVVGAGVCRTSANERGGVEVGGVSLLLMIRPREGIFDGNVKKNYRYSTLRVENMGLMNCENNITFQIVSIK